MSDVVNPLVRHDESRWPDAGSRWKRGVRGLYDASIRGLARVHLRRTLALVGAAGRWTNAVGLLGPAPSDILRLFPALPHTDASRVARDIVALYLKNRAAIAMVQGGRTADLAALVRWPDASRRSMLVDAPQGVVVVACHVGAFFGIRAALHGIGRPVFMMRDVEMPDAASRAAALKKAVESLRSGDLVVATIDGPGGTSTRDVSCLDRHIVLRRGPFTLARLTGCPLIPTVCAWTRDGGIEMRVADPIVSPEWDSPGAGFEDTMAARTAQWLDGYLRAHPEEIWPSTLRNYLSAPPALP